MQSNRDHGSGARAQKKLKGEGLLRAAAHLEHSTVTYPALIALVRLLAREAAAECLAASGGFTPEGEGR